MRWCLLVALLAPGLWAETLTVRGEAGAWSFSFHVPEELPAGGVPALEHSEFEAWHGGAAVATDDHRVELARGAWGYTLSIQPNATARRITLFNHTSGGELWIDTRGGRARLRPGWYRFGDGHTLGVDGAQATLRIEGQMEANRAESAAPMLFLLVTGLLAGVGLAFFSGRSYQLPKTLPESGIAPGHRD